GRHAIRLQRRRRRGPIYKVVERDGIGAAAAEHQHSLETGELGAQRPHHLHVVEALEACRTDERAAFGEPDDVLELAAAEVGPDLVGDGADALAGEEHVRELDPVRQLDGNDVAGAEAQALQRGRGAVHARQQLAVGHAVAVVHERLAVGMRRSAAGEEVVKGFGGRHAEDDVQTRSRRTKFWLYAVPVPAVKRGSVRTLSPRSCLAHSPFGTKTLSVRSASSHSSLTRSTPRGETRLATSPWPRAWACATDG